MDFIRGFSKTLVFTAEKPWISVKNSVKICLQYRKNLDFTKEFSKSLVAVPTENSNLTTQLESTKLGFKAVICLISLEVSVLKAVKFWISAKV